jgi:hypothetical protein
VVTSKLFADQGGKPQAWVLDHDSPAASRRQMLADVRCVRQMVSVRAVVQKAAQIVGDATALVSRKDIQVA